MDITGKQDVILIVTVLTFYIFYHDGNTTSTGKTVNFRHRINNHITACRYRTSIDKFENHIFKCINKNEHVAKEPYFKGHTFMIVNNENKSLCYKSYLHKMRFDTMSC